MALAEIVTVPNKQEDLTAKYNRLNATKERLLRDLGQPSLPGDHATRWREWLAELSGLRADFEFLNQWSSAAKIELKDLEFGRRIRLAGYIFPGELAVMNVKFNGGVDLSGAEFRGPVAISCDLGDEEKRTRLLRFISFQNCSFLDGLRMDGIECTVSCDFTEARFNKGAWFHEAEFKRDLILRSVDCGGVTNLDGASVHGDLDCGAAKLMGGVDAHGCSIKGKVLFGGANIVGDVSFADAVLGGTVQFDSSRLCGNIKFANTQFKGDASFAFEALYVDSKSGRGLGDFCGAAFCANVRFAHESNSQKAQKNIVQIGNKEKLYNLSFENATFDENGVAEFSDLEIFGDISFRKCRVEQPMSFDRCKIDGNLNFDDSKLRRSLTCDNAVIVGGLGVENALLQQASFKRTVFGGPAAAKREKSVGTEVKFIGSRFDGMVNLDSAVFHIPVSFRGSKFDAGLDLDQVQFHGVLPDFRLVNFEVWPSLSRVSFLPEIKKNLASFIEGYPQRGARTLATEKFRAMRLIATKGQDVDRRQFFNRLELKADPGRNLAERWVEGIYGLLADRGDSTLRPLIFLALLTFAFCPAIYVGASNVIGADRLRQFQVPVIAVPVCASARAATAGRELSPIVSALYLSVRSALLLGGQNDSAESEAHQCLFGGEMRWWQWAVAHLMPYGEAMLSFVLLFLAGLGVRRRLRLD
jgi:hypothetical protein